METMSPIDATGAAVALAYGFVQVTGVAGPKFTLLNTGDDNKNYTRLKGNFLGEGPWDGLYEGWLNDKLKWTSEHDDPTQFHFHPGYDTPIGAGLDAVSSGDDQLVDSFWNEFPSGINRLAYSRIAYYFMRVKEKSDSYSDDRQNESSSWADLNFIGIWRALRCRIFDGDGNVEGFAFTTNPAWHISDVILRKKVQPDYSLTREAGPSAMTAAQKARFSWESFYEAAQYYAELLANGRPRFASSYAFSERTTLRAILDQMCLCCRSTVREDAGKIYLLPDRPRPTYFTFGRNHVQPSAIKPNDQKLASAANHVVATFRDLLIPAVDATILSIDKTLRGNPVVTFDKEIPFDTDDRVAIGGTDSSYDRQWVIDSALGYQAVLKSRGVNYPAHVGAGGKMGFLRNRFLKRAPEFHHKAHQFAKGVAGLDLPRRRNRIRVDYDFAVCTYDQVNRIARYERDRVLGPDVTPYVPRQAVDLSAGLMCRDNAGNRLIGARPGARIALNDEASYSFAGDYVLEDFSVTGFGGDETGKPASAAGIAGLTLVPYDESVMYDESDSDGGWDNVPGSDPGSDYTSIPLQDGEAAFQTGVVASGETIQIPSGFPTENCLIWVVAAGTQSVGHHLHVLRVCDVDAYRKATLTYSDGNNPGSNVWPGDLQYALLAWRSQNSVTVSPNPGGGQFVELVLFGGEKVAFGKQYIDVNVGARIWTPAGYTLENTIALAMTRNGVETGDNRAYGFRAYIGADGRAHDDYRDSEGHVWHGASPAVFTFHYLNNMGTWTKTDGWAKCPIPGAVRSFIVGGFQILDGRLPVDPSDSSKRVPPANFVTLPLPTKHVSLTIPDGYSDRSLQVFSTPTSYQIPTEPVEGIMENYIDADNVAHLAFENAEGMIWYGSMAAFALIMDTYHFSSGTGGGTAI